MPSWGGHPRLTKGCLVFVGWLKPSTTNCISDGEISPARGQPAAHPAPPPLQSSRGSSRCNPAEPSETISSIQSGTFWSLLWPERETISAPERLASSLLGGRAGQRAARPTPIPPAKHPGSAPSPSLGASVTVSITYSRGRGAALQQILNWHLVSSF